MKSSAEILEHLRGVISGILERPQMYIGELHSPGAANGLDTVLFMLVRQWCWIQDRYSDFYDALAAVAAIFGARSSVSYMDTYREQHPDVSEEVAVNALLGYWREMVMHLEMDLRWPPEASGDDSERPRSDF